MLGNIKNSFQKEFVTPNGRLSEPTQTAQILALYFNLVAEKDRKRIIDTLAEYIEERDGHLTTGFVGTPYLCHVLSENGYIELAYKLLEREEYPSWLYPITKGATTIWEHWDSIKEDGSFWPDDMNSFNHYAYGAIGDWLYQVVAGIKTDKDNPGYKHIIIAPKPGGSLTTATATLESMYGQIKSAWELLDSKMVLELIIPANTLATVLLPKASINSIKDKGISLKDEIEGVYNYIEHKEGVQLEIGSGEYLFEFDIKE